MTDSTETLRQKLSIAWRFFYGRGFVDGFGHISARTQDPNIVLMTPHDLGKVSHPEDFVLCDLDDTLTFDGRLPSVSYSAMESLERSGRQVVIVTGRPAGWCA